MTRGPARVLLGAPNEARFGFAQAARAGDAIMISGQVAMDDATGVLDPDGSLAGRLRVALGNVAAVTRASGASVADLVHVQVHVAGGIDAPGRALTSAWHAALGDAQPCATLVRPAGLADPAYRVEVSAVAVPARDGSDPTRRTGGGAMLWPDGPAVARAVRAGPHVHVGGQAAPESDRGRGAGAELASAISGLGASLAAVGAGLEHVVSTQVFAVAPVDARGFAELCDAHRAAFGHVRPASTLVLVDALPWAGAVVQIAAAAWVGDPSPRRTAA